MKLYGIGSRISHDVDDWSLTREDAEEKLAQALEDEPEWTHLLYVAQVEFEESANGCGNGARGSLGRLTPWRSPDDPLV